MEQLFDLVKQGDVVLFCGSGLSQASGVPTFRGEDGLWEKYDPNLYVTAEGILTRLKHYPEDLRDFIFEFYTILLKAQPNRAHLTIAAWEKLGYVSGVITQNVDNLQQDAGSSDVCEIHGNAYAFTCRACDYTVKKEKARWFEFLQQLKPAIGRGITKLILDFTGRCPHCRRRLESDIVLFGQPLAKEELVESYHLLQHCRTLICVGTSSVVYPAAAFPYQAKEHGAVIVSVNPEETPLDKISDFTYREEAVSFFSRITGAI
jgi:NAD-dependent deacetylase